jgi:hypothetical protein
LASWIIVPALEDLRIQLNALAPNRDKTSDGGIGDTSHAAGRSSHNPDETGNPEWDKDPDNTPEVRARDFDKDLRHPTVSAEEVVQHLLKYARNGTFWWLRYIIFNKRIWRKSNGWRQEKYTGKNPHDHHFHVNNDFTQKADNVKGVNYRLKELLPKESSMATQFNAEDKVELKSAAVAGVLAYSGGGLASWADQPASRNLLNQLTKQFQLDQGQTESLEELDTDLDVLHASQVAQLGILDALSQDPYDMDNAENHPIVRAVRYVLDNPTAPPAE